MNLNLQFKIKEDMVMSKYLKENSYHYKYLNRSELYFNDFIENMKEEYKLRTSDKINNFTKRLDLISSFLEVIK